MPEPTPLQKGQSFAHGRFVLIQRLGRGGMGEVWLARDERLQEQVALKFLPPEIRGDPVGLDDLRRETARSHKLSHPNIVRIHDLHEEPDGTAFIVMEYIDGPTLAALRLQKPSRVLSWDYLRPLVEQLCAALDYAHGEKVIHRDLKPANMMVDSRGRLKLADFGIAAVASDSMSRISLRHSTSGTLPYMSPQQLTGKRPQAADDIYALGATLYELLTSKPPFYTGDLTHQVLHEPPEPMEERLAALEIENPVPPDVAALVMACLAKEPGPRPQSAGAVAGWIGMDIARKPTAKSFFQTIMEESQMPPGVSAAAPPSLADGATSPHAGRRLGLAAVGIFLATLIALAGWLAFQKTHTMRPQIPASPVGEPATARAANTLETGSQVAASPTSLPRNGIPIAPGQIGEAGGSAAPPLRYGLYIHFGIATFAKAGDGVQIPARRFSPTALDARDWVRLAHDAGMTFAILTAKHESGFCLWDSPDYNYDVSGSPFQRDLVGEFVAACSSGDLVPGVHYSISDYLNESGHKGEVSPFYFALIQKQVAELQTRYPSLRVLILHRSGRLSSTQFDGLRRLVERLNPRCAVWDSEGVEGQHSLAATVIRGWMWAPNSRLNSAQDLFNAYNRAQAAGKAFLLNVGPDATGRVPPEQAAVLMELKKLIANGAVTAHPTHPAVISPQSKPRWTNSLGMVFVPVRGTWVMFSIWDTRVQDFAAFVKTTGYDSTAGALSLHRDGWKQYGDTWQRPGFAQGPTHPVCAVNWNDAHAFCDWLTTKEQDASQLPRSQRYRLPTEAEWDAAVAHGNYIWGDGWPPPQGFGNYGGTEVKDGNWPVGRPTIAGYSDGFSHTSPVGSFAPNRCGLFDMGGNVWQWCEDWSDNSKGRRAARGGSWWDVYPNVLQWPTRWPYGPDERYAVVGFRCVLASSNSP